MPELPEVETTCRTLMPVLGRSVVRVLVRRPEVIEGRRTPAALLAGCRIECIRRHGKEITIVGRRLVGAKNRAQPCLGVHLGMSGALRYWPHDAQFQMRRHGHVIWELDDGSRIEFHDPRRFGGIWTFPDEVKLRQSRWEHLGPDALVIQPDELFRALKKTRRALKAALLDQHLVAGLGNIYVDELLFACRIHPASRADKITLNAAKLMVRKVRPLLQRAIRAKGSTVRSYADSRGLAGAFQLHHQVYGRSGELCRSCGQALRTTRLGGRTTVHCPHCQLRLSAHQSY